MVLKTKTKSWLEESDFWREVTIGVVSTILGAFALYLITTQIPFVFKEVRKIFLEIQLASKDPIVVESLAEEYFKKGMPEKVLAVSNDLMTVGYTASPEADAYSRILKLRKEAQYKLGDTVYAGADTAVVKSRNA